MTMQIPDELKMDGEVWYLKHYFPIESFVKALSRAPRFDDSCSALNRGAIANWMIEHDRLFLLELQSGIKKDAASVLAIVFPESSPPILAKWYSGRLSLFRGQMVERGYTSHFYEFEASLTVEKGIVTKKRSIGEIGFSLVKNRSIERD